MYVPGLYQHSHVRVVKDDIDNTDKVKKRRTKSSALSDALSMVSGDVYPFTLKLSSCRALSALLYSRL